MRKQEFHLANGQSGLTSPSLTAHSETTLYGRVASRSSRIVGPLAISWDLGGCSRITLVLFRTRRRDECLELKEGLGRRVRKSRQKEAAGVCGGRGVIYGISIDFRPESLARSGIRQKGSY